MANSQRRSNRKASGGRYVPSRTKKLRELDRLPTHTRLGKRQSKILRVKGALKKVITMMDDHVNLMDPKTKKYSKVKIDQVIDNPANRNFVRRNIITKGTIVKTAKGNAKIVSRPGQEGMLNAVLIK